MNTEIRRTKRAFIIVPISMAITRLDQLKRLDDRFDWVIVPDGSFYEVATMLSTGMGFSEFYGVDDRWMVMSLSERYLMDLDALQEVTHGE